MSPAAALFVLALQMTALTVNAQLFGLLGAGEQLVSIDPKSGQMTNIGPARNLELDAQGLSSVDSKTKTFYFVGYNASNQAVTLVGVDMKTGQYKSQTKVPVQEGAFVGVGQSCNVDPTTGDVFVSGVSADGTGLHHVYRVTPSTGRSELLVSMDGIDVLGGASSYDPVNNILWLQFGLKYAPQINFIGVDVKKKQIAWNISDSTFNLETISFDPVKGRMIGVGLNIIPGPTPKFMRTVVALDSRTGKFQQVCTVPDYFIINAGTSALNAKDRLIYAYLEKGASGPFFLLSINADSCQVTAAPGCAEPSSCAWNLGFLA